MAATALDITWQRAADGLDETSLRALLAGEIAAVRMDGFASAKECAAFCAAIREGSAVGSAAATQCPLAQPRVRKEEETLCACSYIPSRAG